MPPEIRMQIGEQGFEPAAGAVDAYAAANPPEPPPTEPAPPTPARVVSAFQALLDLYRPGPETFEVGGGMVDQPAPPWVADLARAIEHAAPKGIDVETVIGAGRVMLRWVAKGEPVSRASRLLALFKLWPGGQHGPGFLGALDLGLQYVTIMQRTHGGRAKTGAGLRPDGSWGEITCRPKPFVAPTTHASWADVDQARTTAREEASWLDTLETVADAVMTFRKAVSETGNESRDVQSAVSELLLATKVLDD